MSQRSEVPLCPKCGERHWRHEPCEKPEIDYNRFVGLQAEKEVTRRIAADMHDFRDRGNPMVKNYGPEYQDDRFDAARGRRK